VAAATIDCVCWQGVSGWWQALQMHDTNVSDSKLGPTEWRRDDQYIFELFIFYRCNTNG
jgi:hypothetical protein